MRSDILTAAVVVLAVGPICGAGPAGAMVQKVPLAAGKMTVLVQDQQQQQQLKQQQLQQQQQFQRQELMEREKAAKAMRRAMIKHEEEKVIGTVKKYLHPEYESYHR
jgi:predicted Holliday junction resolvase-like endonuclease